MRTTPSVLAGVSEERLLFDSHGVPLFGVWRRGERTRGPLVMFCNSFAADLESKYRAEVNAARYFAAAGYQTFSYHPRGHGDSAGDFAELVFSDLIDDALSAASCAAALSGVRRIVWVGIRFGALVAAAAMRQRADAIGLALWEPVHSAREYFAELFRQMAFRELAEGKQPAQTVDQMLGQIDHCPTLQVNDFTLHREFALSALPAELSQTLNCWRGPTLIVQFRGRMHLARANERLRRLLRAGGATVTLAKFQQQVGRSARRDPWWFAEDVTACSRAWLDELA